MGIKKRFRMLVADIKYLLENVKQFGPNGIIEDIKYLIDNQVDPLRENVK